MRVGIVVFLLSLILGITTGFKLALASALIYPIDETTIALDKYMNQSMMSVHKANRVIWESNPLTKYSREDLLALYQHDAKVERIRWNEFIPEADEIWSSHKNREVFLYFRNGKCLGVRTNPYYGLHRFWGDDSVALSEFFELCCSTTRKNLKSLKTCLILESGGSESPS